MPPGHELGAVMVRLDEMKGDISRIETGIRELTQAVHAGALAHQGRLTALETTVAANSKKIEDVGPLRTEVTRLQGAVGQRTTVGALGTLLGYALTATVAMFKGGQ